MNQTKKRLAIIKLAISMTDTETIQLQVLKLGLLKTDSKMREILTLLSAHNYAQAQKLISDYINSPQLTTVMQRSYQEKIQQAPEEAIGENKESITTTIQNNKPLNLKEKIQQAKDQEIIEQFELFSVTSKKEKNTSDIPSDLYDDLDITYNSKKTSTETIDCDTLLNVNTQDVMTDNMSLSLNDNEDIKLTEEKFFNEELHIQPNNITNKDNVFNQEEDHDVSKITTSEELQKIQPSIQTKDRVAEEELFIDEPIHYEAISYIDQKFKNMIKQYPPIHNSDTEYTSVNAWLHKISNKGYFESEIEKMIKHIEQLITTNKAEAAQLLLITAATESKYAQFRLARELYKGELLEKNLSESFTLINRLAMNDNYPEAICDLAQFYENGISTKKDKEKAEELYKEAMKQGINRAINHYNRLHKINNSLFSFFNK